MADALSRAYLSDVMDDSDLELEVHSLVATLPVTSETKQEFRKNTSNDATLSALLAAIKDSWPQLSKLPADLKPFWDFRENIFEHDGLLFNGHRLIVPECLRKTMLQKLHVSHMGIDKMRSRARQCIFWPGINEDIAQFSRNCQMCQVFQRKNTKEKLISHFAGDRPWQKVACDICSYGGLHYLVTIDYYSNWIEVDKLGRSSTAQSVISCLKAIFGRLGIPEFFMSDNMPFNSREFRSFARDYDFQLITSSPHYPRSNGMAEMAVKLVKSMLKKSNDLSDALLEYRSTPLTGQPYSPAQVIFGRQIRTRLPVLSSALTGNVQMNKTACRRKQKMNHDQHAQDLDPLCSGQSVWLRDPVSGRWEGAMIVGVHDNNRSYWVRNQNGNIVRRNRIDLRKSVKLVGETAMDDDGPAVVDGGPAGDNGDSAVGNGVCLRRSNRTNKGVPPSRYGFP